MTSDDELRDKVAQAITRCKWNLYSSIMRAEAKAWTESFEVAYADAAIAAVREWDQQHKIEATK